MPLRFGSEDQPFTFVDPKTLLTVPAEDLEPGTTYDTFVTIENSDSFEYFDLQINVWHSAFGIGLLPGTVGLTQPQAITVPPREFGVAGTAIASFTFRVPTEGYDSLGAKISPDGPTIWFNQMALKMPSGTQSRSSFVLFGGTSEREMVLTIKELDQNGNQIHDHSNQSWKPQLVAPAGTGPAEPTAFHLCLTLSANTFYSVGLQLQIPEGKSEPHRIQISCSVEGQLVGNVNFKIYSVASSSFDRPEPYVIGGYQSPDILISDSKGNVIPLGGSPTGTTMLQPDSDYMLSAVLHNDSDADAVNTVVRFWEIPFGTATNGYLLDIRTVTVPAAGNVLVTSSIPFRSALPGMHSCAAVSVYNAMSLTATFDPVDASEIPWTQAGSHGPTAWRNTDSMLVFRGKPWTLCLAVSDSNLTERMSIEACAAKIPQEFETTATNDDFGQLGGEYPLYLLSGIQENLPKADLKLKVRTATNGQYTIEGEIPPDAKPGDKYLVTVHASYTDRTVQFFETLFVGHEPVLKS